MTLQENIGARLRVAREAANITRDDAAAKLGLKTAAVQHHESGARGIANEYLAKYCRLYNVRVGWLIEGTGRMTRETDEVTQLLEAIADDAQRETWREMGRHLAATARSK